jgi:hypothetical protein
MIINEYEGIPKEAVLYRYLSENHKNAVRIGYLWAQL